MQKRMQQIATQKVVSNLVSQFRGPSRAWGQLAILAAAACLGSGTSAHAQVTRTWSTFSNSAWSNTANWAGGVAAGALGTTTNTDTALLSASLTTTQNIIVGTNRNIQSLTIDGGSANTSAWQLLIGNFWLTSGGTIQLTGSGGARTDRVVIPLLLLGNNASYTFANNSSLSTRLLQIEGSVTGQSTTGNTTTIYLDGSNTGDNRFRPSAISGGTNGGGLAIVKQGGGTWSWTAGGGSLVAGSFIPVTINEGRLAGNQVISAPRSLTLANVAGAEYQFPGGGGWGGLGSLSGGGALGGNLTNIDQKTNLGGLYIGFDNTSTTFSGRATQSGVDASNGGLNKVGTGTLTLTGSDNNFALNSRVQVRQGGLRLDFSQSTTGTDILTATQGIGFAGGQLLLTGSSGGSNSQSFASTTVSAGSRLALTSNGATDLVASLAAITRSVGGTLDITLPDGSQSATNGVRTTTVTAANGVLATAASNGIAYATVSGTSWAELSGASGTVNILPLSSYATGNANYTAANNIDVTDADAPSAFTVNTLRFNGNNTLNLTGANTVATGGVLATTAAGTGATISSGTLRSGGGRELVFHNYGSQLTIGSTIADSLSGASNLTLSGTGRYLLNGNMTHTGTTRIMSGSVQLGSSSALGTDPKVDIAADPNATLDLNGFDLTIGALSGAGGVQGASNQAVNATTNLFNMTGGLVNVGSKSLSVGSLNTSTVYNGRIAGSGTFAKVGTSQLAMYGANAFAGFNGTIVVESGTLQAGVYADQVYGYDSFGAASIVLGKAGSANATLDLGSGTTARPITLATGNSGTLTIATTGASAVYSGAITGPGNLVFFRNSSTSDAFTISGTINNAGTVTFTTVSPNADNRRYTVSGEIGSSVTDLTLRVSSPSSNANASTFSGPIKNTGALLIEGQAGASGPVNLSGTISSISSLTLTSLSGTTPRAIFSAANTFTAPVSIQSGTLIASNAQALGIDSAVTLANSANAVLNPSGVNLAIGSLSGVGPGGNVFFVNAASRLTTGGANTNTTFSGSASGAGGFTKIGTGTFTLDGTTTNTGTNFVNQGTLRLASAGAIATAPMNVAESGVLDLAVNVATTGTVTMSGSAASILGLGTLTAPGYAFTNTSGTSSASVNLLGAGGLTKSGSGIGLLSGINTYSGTTSITGGVLSITSTAALPGWDTPGRYTTSAGGALVVGNAVTDADFNTIRTTGTFLNQALIGFDTTAGDRTYAGTPLANIGSGTAIGLMKIGTGTLTMNAANTYTGTTSVRGGTLRLETAAALPNTSPIWVQDSGALELVQDSTTSGAVTMSGSASSIFGPGSLTAASYTVNNASGTASATTVLAGAGGLTKSNAGTLSLTAANAYQGKTTVSGGTLEFNSIANSGTGNFSALGAPAAGGNSTIDLGSGTNAATLRYTGSGHTSNRVINLAGSTGPVALDASGSGALELTAANTAAASTKTFTLTGTSTAANSIGVIAGTGVSVNKTGSGLWRLTGASTYGGQLRVLDGTVVVASTVGTSGGGPFGDANSSQDPVVGSDAAGLTGTAALLAEGVSIERNFSVASLGAGSQQAVVIGNTGSGTTVFSGAISLARSVTLQSSADGIARFSAALNNSGTGVAITIGSADNAGTVALQTTLAGSLAAVNVVNGTALLEGADNRINSATPVTVGSALGSATLNLNSRSQTLSNLTFAGNSGSITGGTLRLNPSQAVAVTGTGHVISSLVALDSTATFNTASAAALTVSNVISNGTNGAQSLTKSGLGALTLSAANTYSGPTTVSEGLLMVNGSQAAASTVTVASGGVLGGTGLIAGGVTGDRKSVV